MIMDNRKKITPSHFQNLYKNTKRTMSDLKKSIPLLSMFILKTSVFLLFLLDLFPITMEHPIGSQRYAQASNCQQKVKNVINDCIKNEQLREARIKIMELETRIDRVSGAAKTAKITEEGAKKQPNSLMGGKTRM